MIRDMIAKVVKGNDLTDLEMEQVMEEIMTGGRPLRKSGPLSRRYESKERRSMRLRVPQGS